jgi:Tfp pilus assembly protein PilO
VNRYRQFFERYGERLDVLGVVGIGLAVFAFVLFMSTVLPAREEAGRLQAKLARLQRTAVQVPHDGNATERGMSQLAAFTRNLPTLTEVPGWILKIHEIAARNELTLETGEYRLTNAKDGGLARYQITLPLHGGYAQVRTFLQQVLTQIPAAALDEVTIRRESVGSRATETRVRLTLYLAGAK